MQINEQQQSFIDKRKRLSSAWHWVGPLCLLLIVAFIVWLYVSNPLLVNPFEIMSRLEQNDVEHSTLALMAVMLPIMFLACFGLLIALVLMIYAAFHNERKYFKILSSLDKDSKNLL